MRKRTFSASKSVKKGVFRPENMQKREKSLLSFKAVAKTTIKIDRFMSQALGQPGAQAKKNDRKIDHLQAVSLQAEENAPKGFAFPSVGADCSRV